MKYYIFIFSILIVFSAKSQSIFQFPENIKSSHISTFENINGEKGKGGKTNQTAKGNAFEELKAGQSKVLLNINGPGIIQRMWFTVRDRSPEMCRSMRLQFYWDGATKPAVDVPFGDFFGYGLAKTVKFETAFFSNPEGRSFNCNIPMPFKTGAKVVIINESDKDIGLLFFDIDFVKLNSFPTGAMYFHAFWKRQKTSVHGSEYEFLPQIKGKGRYLGVNMGVNAGKYYENTWWGEGEVKMFIDNDKKFPTWNGTGAEDYIGTAWGLGQYTNLYQGATVADDSAKQYAFYRFHVKDEIIFRENFRASIQQIGGGERDLVRKLIKNNHPLKPVTVQWEGGFRRLLDDPKDIFDNDFPNGWVNFYRVDDYSSTAYFYLDKPVSVLPELINVVERVK
ncbi:MAG: DUF2961 domain-containing protein [Cytophagaceae bacterium]|nr:DUF2961 domain-containing protein [Cytophagaceae bacterium]